MKGRYRKSPSLWKIRPLEKDLIQCAAYDSVILHLFNEDFKNQADSRSMNNAVSRYANNVWANTFRDSKNEVVQGSAQCFRSPTNKEFGISIKPARSRRDLESFF